MLKYIVIHSSDKTWLTVRNPLALATFFGFVLWENGTELFRRWIFQQAKKV